MPALTNATGMLSCRVAADGLNVILFLMISRLFGPKGVGAYAYAFAVATLIYAMTALGIEQYAMREYQHATVAGRSQLIGELLGLQLCMVALLTVALSVYLAATRADPATVLLVCSLSVYQLCSAVAATLFAPAMAQQEMLPPAVATLLARGGAFAVAAFMLLVADSPLESALLAFPLAGVVLVGCAALSARRHLGKLRLHIAVPALARAYRAMRSFAAADMLAQFLPRIGIIVLSLMIGAGAAGVYAAGQKFIELFFLPLWFVGVALYPRLCQAFAHDRAGFSKLTAQLLWIALGATAAIGLIMYYVVPRALVLVLGDEYAGTEHLIAAMALIALLYGPEIALGRLLFAVHLQRERARAIGTGAAVGLALAVLLVPRFAIPGAIAATVMAYLVVVLWYALSVAPAEHVRRHTQASPH